MALSPQFRRLYDLEHPGHGGRWTPYSSGQTINVVVSGNSTMSPATASLRPPAHPAVRRPRLVLPRTYNCSGNYYLEECVDPGGTAGGLPTTAAGCESATLGLTPGIRPPLSGAFYP